MPTTLKDIAAAAGVSIGTVERALKNRDRINPQVAERIRQIAKEMDYQPNKIASGLVKRSRKYKIAVIFHITGSEFWNEVLKGIHKAEKEIKDYGMSVQMYFGNDFDPQVQLTLIDQALQDGANAIVIIPINSPVIAKRIRQLNKENFPVVFLNTYLNRISCLSSIHCDYYRSGRIGGMLADRLSGGTGHVMAFLPSSVMLGNNYRKDGIADYFKDAPSKKKKKKIVELKNMPENDMETMIRELREHNQVGYIIYCGDTNVALSAIKKVNRPFTSIFYDLSSDAKKALLDGRIDAAIVQSQKEQGYRSIDVLSQYLTSGIEPKKEILMDCQILFKECID